MFFYLFLKQEYFNSLLVNIKLSWNCVIIYCKASDLNDLNHEKWNTKILKMTQ